MWAGNVAGYVLRKERKRNVCYVNGPAILERLRRVGHQAVGEGTGPNGKWEDDVSGPSGRTS